MVRAVYSKNQVEMAELLLVRSRFWVRGIRKRDRLQIVIFPSSRGGRAAYYTRCDGGACSCPSYQYRGGCAHSLACKMDAERAAEQHVPLGTASDPSLGTVDCY